MPAFHEWVDANMSPAGETPGFRLYKWHDLYIIADIDAEPEVPRAIIIAAEGYDEEMLRLLRAADAAARDDEEALKVFTAMLLEWSLRHGDAVYGLAVEGDAEPLFRAEEALEERWDVEVGHGITTAVHVDYAPNVAAVVGHLLSDLDDPLVDALRRHIDHIYA